MRRGMRMIKTYLLRRTTSKGNVIMSTDAPFEVTEWDWFKLQLELSALRGRGQSVGKLYYFCDKDKTVTFSLYWLLDPKEKTSRVSREKHLEAYMSWLIHEKRLISELLGRMPILRSSFRVEEHLTFNVLYQYRGDTSPMLACQIKGKNVEWSEWAKSALLEQPEHEG